MMSQSIPDWQNQVTRVPDQEAVSLAYVTIGMKRLSQLPFHAVF